MMQLGLMVAEQINCTVLMTEAEARQAVVDIRAGLVDVGNKLLELKEREGWKALGYTTWRECAQAEFNFSQSYVYRLVGAAEVRRNISPMGEKVPLPNERQARPLTQLEPEEQSIVWQRVVEESHGNNGKITGAAVRRVVEEMDIVSVSADTHRIQIRSNNEWYTPSIYLEAARIVMEGIDLDPASSIAANENVKAVKFYAKGDNSLLRHWYGRVWLNPPYGTDGPKFVARLLDEHRAGNTTEAILLVNANATETQWFAPLWNHVLCFVQGRINFISNVGERNGSTHGSVFIYLGPNRDRFTEVFKQFGPIVQRID